MRPKFDLDKIKYGVDEATFRKAIDLSKSGKVINFREAIASYTADVIGTHLYHVSIEARDYRYCYCSCYLGQNGTLCKHAIAVAIHAVTGGRKLTKEEENQITKPVSSKIHGELSSKKLESVKKELTRAISYIKYYQGPSKTWFAYQNSLDEGVNRLATIISKLPVSIQTADLIVNMLLRLDKKLQGGVDDFNGTVGGFIEEAVKVLIEFAKIDPECKKGFRRLRNIKTCFGWEEELIKLL